MRFAMFLWAMALCVLASGGSQACDISLIDIRNVHFSGSQRYQVFAGTEAAQAVQFTVRQKRNEPGCSYFVTLSRGGSSTFDRRMADGAGQLRYQVYDSPAKSNVLKDLPEAGAQEVLSGRFLPSNDVQTQTLVYFVAVPALQVEPPGRYRDDFVLRLYEGTLDNHVQRDSATVGVNADIDTEVGVCLGCEVLFDANAQTYEMNFGVLEEGETRAVTVRARSNDGYRISMTSEYRGVMRHTSDTDFVRYQLTVNGAEVNLSGKSVEVAQRTGRTAAPGDALSVQVRIGSVVDLTAGDYRDHITITVAAY